MFDRLELLIGKDALNKLNNSNVVILGLGGVGGHALEALVRSGIGNVTIIDSDTIDISNLNRQIIATNDNIGNFKTLEFEKRIKSINKNIKINIITEFIDSSNIDSLFKEKIDFFIDACDSIETKKLVIKKCLEKDIKFITSMGAGNRMDPSKLEIKDLNKTSGDPIARILRKYVKESNLKGKITCVCSSEVPLRKGAPVSSNSFVPASCGLLIASYVIKTIIKGEDYGNIKM